MEEIQRNASNLLQLSRNELITLALLKKHSTPFSLAKECSIPRPTIYVTLQKLQRRGLVIRKKSSNKTSWKLNSVEHIEKLLSDLQRILAEGEDSFNEKVFITDKSHIVVHKGKNNILKILQKLTERHAGERILMIQGNQTDTSWEKVLGLRNIDNVNKKIKEQGIITELITSRKWFEKQIELFGPTWAINFEGRSMQVQNVDDKYLDYSSQIFIFKDKMYLVSMSEEVFIEVKNTQISRLLVSLSRFIQDNSKMIDANQLLRELLEKNGNRNSNENRQQ